MASGGNARHSRGADPTHLLQRGDQNGGQSGNQSAANHRYESGQLAADPSDSRPHRRLQTQPAALEECQERSERGTGAVGCNPHHRGARGRDPCVHSGRILDDRRGSAHGGKGDPRSFLGGRFREGSAEFRGGSHGRGECGQRKTVYRRSQPQPCSRRLPKNWASSRRRS